MENARLSRQVASPSWEGQVRAVRREFALAMRLPDAGTMPLTRIAAKLANYRLAASHGIAVPEVLAVWDRLQDVDLRGLPDRFVLKSERGSASRGVLPVVREGELFALADGSGRHTARSLVEHFAALEAVGRVVAPYFAEELLADASGRALPVDVKVYAFYGEVGHVLLRATDRHGSSRSVRRYLTEDGTHLTGDDSLPVPGRLADAVGAARALSLAVPFPFVRVDLYDTPRGIVLGELTLAPGGQQRYSADHDRALGELHERAHVRLLQDLHRGRPWAFLYGDHPLDAVPQAWHAPGQPEARWTGPLPVDPSTGCVVP